MKSKMLRMLPVIALCLAPWCAQANDIEPGKEFYTATRAGGAVTLDGNLSEWAGVPVLSDPRFYVRTGAEGTAAGKGSGGVNATLVLFERYNGGDWTGPDDHTSAVQVIWDVDNVYFGFVVTDEYHEDSANSAWNGDSVQLMIANADRNQQIALYNYALGGIEGALGEVIVMHEAGPGGTEAVVTRDEVKKKTYYEIKLPASSLGMTPPLQAGIKFGLGMAINDGDEATPGQKGWGGLGAHSIVFGKTPSETALVTLGSDLPTVDRLFFSAINPTVNAFTFRATDKGASIVDPASAKLTIDGTSIPLTSKKTGDATDFTATITTPFPPKTDHTYVIEVKDTQGNLVTTTANFSTPAYALLTAADKVTADTSKPGFIWNVHQNPAFQANNNVRPLLQLAGLLGQNYADPTAQGAALGAGTRGANNNAAVKFEIATTINLDQESGSNGDFTPDDQMPGIPGTSESNPTDGIAGEIITYIELPAGKHTFIVNSDDGFRTTAGRTMNDLFQSQVAGEFSGGRGAADTPYDVYVLEAGVYPFRTVWEEGGGGANIEWKTVKADGTRVLLNDTANGGFKTYRASSTALPAYVKAVSPAPDSTMLGRPKTIEAVLVDGATQIDTTSVALKLNGTAVAATATKTASETRVVHTVPGELLSSTEYTAELTFADNAGSRTVTWKFKTGPLSPNIFVIEAEDFDYDGGQANPQKGVTGLDVDKMPYLGGAYDQLAAVEGIDYNNNDGNDSDQYRTELDENGENEVNITGNLSSSPGNGSGGSIPIAGGDRGAWTMTANYRIGWVEGGSWQNYTRTFPDNGVGGWWKVYAALSYDGSAAGQLAGSLDRVTAGVGTVDQTTERLGSFSAPGSGGWGNNNLVPMKNASGGDALAKLQAKTTVRFNLGSGDIDFLIFVPAPPPPPFLSAAPQDSVKSGEAVLDWTIQDTDAKVNATSIKVFVDDNDVTSKVTSTKTATGATVHLDMTGTAMAAGDHAWRITFTDSANGSGSGSGAFVVVPYPAQSLFVIEAEDFNYSDDGVTGGKTNPKKGTADLDVDVMPYLGGAYDGLAAVEGVDYNNNDGNDSNAYRTELDANGENEVNITSSNGNRFSNDRGAFETTSNYRIGWVEGGSWQNYTRTFPAGDFNVWAALSFDGRAAGQLNGSLDLVTSDPTKPNQVTERLGSFNAPGSGGWGRNELVPMKDTAGKMSLVSVGGVQTVRFNLGSGDFDYLLFVPATKPPELPKFTSIKKNADGTITVEWTGGGTLQAAPTVAGPWQDVTGATSPFKFTPTANVLFGRIRR